VTSDRVPVWAEAIQLLPILSLAFPFIVQGSVDLARAGSGFALGALLTIPVSVAVRWRGHPLNPILIGTGLWLWLGAAAFLVPVEAVAAWLARTQAFGLFVAALGAGLLTTFASRWGYVACPSSDSTWTRRASYGLLGATVLAVACAWLLRNDIRLGGGLPFITLNVLRRVLVARAPHANRVPAGGSSGTR